MTGCELPRIVIPLDELMLCIDCGGTFEAGYRSCPGCASAQIVSLARFLNRERDAA